MRNYQVIRICFLLFGIFTAGVITGRITAPQPAAVIVNSRGNTHTPASFVALMTDRIGIDATQQETFISIFRKMVREMQPYSPRTQERYNIFVKTMESARGHIRPEQMKAFDQFFTNQLNQHWSHLRPKPSGK